MLVYYSQSHLALGNAIPNVTYLDVSIIGYTNNALNIGIWTLVIKTQYSKSIDLLFLKDIYNELWRPIYILTLCKHTAIYMPIGPVLDRASSMFLKINWTVLYHGWFHLYGLSRTVSVAKQVRITKWKIFANSGIQAHNLLIRSRNRLSSTRGKPKTLSCVVYSFVL